MGRVQGQGSMVRNVTEPQSVAPCVVAHGTEFQHSSMGMGLWEQDANGEALTQALCDKQCSEGSLRGGG